MTLIQPKEAKALLDRYMLNISVPCPVPHCRARAGEACRDTPLTTVHASRLKARLEREGKKS